MDIVADCEHLSLSLPTSVFSMKTQRTTSKRALSAIKKNLLKCVWTNEDKEPLISYSEKSKDMKFLWKLYFWTELFDISLLYAKQLCNGPFSRNSKLHECILKRTFIKVVQILKNHPVFHRIKCILKKSIIITKAIVSNATTRWDSTPGKSFWTHCFS